MTDNLRDRIANAIFLNVPADPIINSVECYGMADAAITALGLRQERHELLARYVTEWENEEMSMNGLCCCGHDKTLHAAGKSRCTSCGCQEWRAVR